MAPFRFRLQPALEIAAREEQAAQRAWLRARSACKAAAAALREIEARIAAGRIAPVRGASASIARLRLADERRRALEPERLRASAQLARGERELGLSRAGFEAAMKRRSAFERLRERRRAVHELAEALRRAREFDEANARGPALAVCGGFGEP
jgi:flagellar export protein FliJ